MSVVRKADTVRYITLQPDSREYFRIPAHGYLEGIELVPLRECPNMDARNGYQLGVILVGPDGARIPLEVRGRFRNVVPVGYAGPM